MKELRYLVFFDKIGYYANKQSKETEDWTFTKRISESKRHKTIHGAFIRLDYANNIPEFKNVNKGVLVEQLETIDNKEIIKLVAKLDYKTMDRIVAEKEIEQPRVDIEPNKHPKKETSGEITTETTTKKKRGRPSASNKIQIEGYQPTVGLTTTPPNKKDITEEPGNVMEAEAENEEIKTEPITLINDESHVKVAKISTEDSFWD